MLGTIVHRGPDDQGIHDGGHAVLGVRRLKIIDLEGGHQPLSNEDGTVWVVYNGEIYNHAALHQELEAKGHRFTTRCDTEVLVHAWEEWGLSFVDRFQGMFGFAIWDARTETLVIGRDRLGIKPVYYAWDGSRLAFGSEIKAVLASGYVRQRARPRRDLSLRGLRVRAGARDDVPRRPKAAGRTPPDRDWRGEARRSPSASTGTCRSSRRSVPKKRRSPASAVCSETPSANG